MSINSSDRQFRVAVVAHDARKSSLVDWIGLNIDVFETALIHSTGTTGGQVAEAYPQLDIVALKSGPLGGDQQIGAMICEGELDALIFFVDPLSPLPHDVGVKALTRLATVYDLPMACSTSTASMIAQSVRCGDIWRS